LIVKLTDAVAGDVESESLTVMVAECDPAERPVVVATHLPGVVMVGAMLIVAATAAAESHWTVHA
jgi:hypothetical protein